MNHIAISIGAGRRPLIFPPNEALESKCPWPAVGLCNQLFHLMGVINHCNFEHDVLYCDYFNKDMHNISFLNYSELFDFAEMNANNKWNLKDLTSLETLIDYRVWPFENPWKLYIVNKRQFKDIAQKLIFNKTWVDLANCIIADTGIASEEVNLVQLRIDSDVKDHLKKRFPTNPKIFENYLSSYKQSIYKHCSFDKKLVLLLGETDHPFVKELQKDYNVIFFDKEIVLNSYYKLYNKRDFDGREMFALIDLLIAKNLKVNKYILSHGKVFISSFGILLKYLNTYKSIVAV